MTETELSRAIQDALSALGAMVIRVQSGSLGVGSHRVHGARAGTPDLWVAFRNWHGWLEIKTPDGVLSPVQEQWHAVARQHGVKVFIARSVEAALREVRGE